MEFIKRRYVSFEMYFNNDEKETRNLFWFFELLTLLRQDDIKQYPNSFV